VFYFSVQLTLIILLYTSISNALRSAALTVQDSHPYVATDQTKVCMSLLFNCRFKKWSFHRLGNDLAVDLAMPSLVVISVLQSHVSIMMLPIGTEMTLTCSKIALSHVTWAGVAVVEVINTLVFFVLISSLYSHDTVLSLFISLCNASCDVAMSTDGISWWIYLDWCHNKRPYNKQSIRYADDTVLSTVLRS